MNILQSLMVTGDKKDAVRYKKLYKNPINTEVYEANTLYFVSYKAAISSYSASLRSSILSPCVGASVFSKSVIPAFTRMLYH